MTKQAFLNELAAALSALSPQDREDSVAFYREMIEEKIEAGSSEQEAVATLGSPATVAHDILLDMPLPTLIRSKYKPNRALRVWEIILLILGSPIWLSVLLTLFAVVLTVYIVLWAVMATLWAVDAGLFACALGGVALFFAWLPTAPANAIFYLGAGSVGGGLALLFLFLCCALTKQFIKLSVWITKCLKRLIIGKGDQHG